MQTAHEPYSAPYEPTMVAIPEPPRWPRLTARIIGTIGLVLIGPFSLFTGLGTILNLADGGGGDTTPVIGLIWSITLTIASAMLALGLLIAWWREGIGGLLILAGTAHHALLVLVTFGFALIVVFPAPIVGGLYLLSWALHRTDDTSNSLIDRLSRWVRRAYHGRSYESF